jgi:membrane fusion protein, multidrug efflux system
MIKQIALVFVLVVYGFSMDKGPSLVNTAKVTKGVVNPLEEFIGTLNFSKSSKIASATSGNVEKADFQTGDHVKKGDILVKIDSDILDAQIKSARSSVDIAKVTLENSSKNHERYSELLKTKAVSQQIYDDSFTSYTTAKANLTKSQALLDELLVQRSKKTIKAPFDGIIVTKDIEVAEWANSGKVVATLVDTSNIDLTFNLPTSYVYKLDSTRKYTIELGGKTITSKLYAAIPKGDTRTRTFPVKFVASINEGFVYDGMEAKIKLPRDKDKESLVVPRDAVIKRFGGDVIFIDSDGKATMFPVKVVGYNNKSIAIEAQGLVEGANVVIKGNERIFPNQPIKVLNKQ